MLGQNYSPHDRKVMNTFACATKVVSHIDGRLVMAHSGGHEMVFVWVTFGRNSFDHSYAE
jgi:hypothetical protein